MKARRTSYIFIRAIDFVHHWWSTSIMLVSDQLATAAQCMHHAGDQLQIVQWRLCRNE